VNFYELSLVFHLLGVAFGLGGATVSDVLFLKSLKDEKITPKEKSFLDAASSVIWVGIGILLLSGSVMFWLNWDVLSQQPRALAHVSIAAVIIANGILLNLFVSPKISYWSRKKERDQKFVPEYRKLRKIAFMIGAVSITSWYSALVLGFGRRFIFPPLSYVEIMGIYLLVEIFAILAVLAIENFSWQKHMKSLQ